MFRLRSKLLGKKALESANGNWPVNLTPTACGFARMRANSPADAGQRVGIAGDAVGFFEAAIGNQSNIASSVGVCRTGHHAREVGIQPVPVDLFIFVSLQHAGTVCPRER